MLIKTASPCLEHPISQACTQSQLDSSVYRNWCAKLGIAPVPHRKNWEWCYILQALAVHGMLESGRRGLGFGVGSEPLADLIASFDCKITATDQAPDKAKTEGWADTNQHAAQLSALRKKYATQQQFDQNVSFAVADMNDIPASFQGYDFTWSACALEHLGSLAAGLRFIERSLETLRPGGVAIHTTELNCSSETLTVDDDWCVLYRRSDLQSFAERMTTKGHNIELNFDTGDLPNDKFVDVPPYTHNPHLKLKLGEFVTTSYGLIIRRSG